MASDRSEQLITVPSELVVSGKGLALDIGGSVLKFVYRTKEDYDEAVENSGKIARLHLVSFGRNELVEGLDYVRQRAYLRRDDGEPLTLYTTGVGCTNYGKTICEALDIKLDNLTEFDCFVKSFLYLADHLPRHELLQPFLLDAVTEPVEQMESQISLFKSFQDKNLTQGLSDIQLSPSSSRDGLMMNTGRHAAAATVVDVEASSVEQPLSSAEDDVFPCLMVMCGSGYAFMKVEKDRTFRIMDGSNRAGKGFYGVGSLLTGCKSFDELIELASRGNVRNVDQFSDEVVDVQNAAEGDNSLYAISKDMKPALVFCFGNVASGRGNYSREDLAASWLQWVVLDLVQTVSLCCRACDVRRIFFCGGFLQEEVVRRVITTEMARRNLAYSLVLQQWEPVIFDFIKPGQHLGALGCLLNGIERSAA